MTPEQVKALVLGYDVKPKPPEEHWICEANLEMVALLEYDPKHDQPVCWHKLDFEKNIKEEMFDWAMEPGKKTELIPVPVRITFPDLSTRLDYRRITAEATFVVKQTTFGLVRVKK